MTLRFMYQHVRSLEQNVLDKNNTITSLFFINYPGEASHHSMKLRSRGTHFRIIQGSVPTLFRDVCFHVLVPRLPLPQLTSTRRLGTQTCTSRTIALDSPPIEMPNCIDIRRKSVDSEASRGAGAPSRREDHSLRSSPYREANLC